MDNSDLNTFIKELDEKLRSYEGLRGDGYKETLRDQFNLAKRFYGYLLKSERVPDDKLFDDIAMDMDADLMGWVVELPFALSDYGGMIDEAVEVCNLFAEVHSPENFFGDMAVILAEAGRHDEALERIAKNLERFSDDAWIVIKAGQAYQTLEETDKAIALYNQAYKMTSPLSYDRAGVLERLIPLLKKLGRDDEATALIENEEQAEKARKASYKKHEKKETTFSALADNQKPMPVTARKIGRNEPCPCGSGKKYKKCCLKRDEENAFATLTGTRSDDDIISADTVFDYGKPCIDDAFLRTNDVHEISGLRLLYSLILNPIVEELAHKTVLGFLNRGREEMDLITNATGVEALLAIMRNNPDPINHAPLMKKLVSYREQAVPRILQELKKPQNDSFVELSARILHRTGKNYSKELIDIITAGENRNAYAISVLCVLLGFYDNDESEKLMWDYYHYMKRTYPNNTYSDGPLLGLIEMRERKREQAFLH